MLDIISGCYWTNDEEGAHLQMLEGRGGLDFAAAQPLTNIAGKPLQNVQVNGDDRLQTLAICTEQHAVDYDDDGDLDLVVGCFGKKFYLYENLASPAAAENRISDKPVCLPVESPYQHAAPHLVDWDNDGDLDLLSGSSDGGAVISHNAGTRQRPEWEPFKQLIPPSSRWEQMAEEGIEMGPSTRIWATDFNRDGLMDLLVGDSTMIIAPANGLSKTQWKTRRTEFDEKMKEISQAQQEIAPKFQEAVQAGKEPPAELNRQLEQLNERMMEIYNSRSEFESTQRTGHVWLLIRKPETSSSQTTATESQTLSKLD